VYTNNVEVLDDVSDEKTAFERIQAGFYAGVNGDGILTGLRKTDYVLAAKSGTAEVFDETGTDYPNQALIAYAPYENPRLTYACIAPREGGNSKTCQSIVGQIFDKYFEKYGLSQ
ncbi:MAG: penicillin-binding transpeptidase domain-containing protein, partial [Beduini sp.]